MNHCGLTLLFFVRGVSKRRKGVGLRKLLNRVLQSKCAYHVCDEYKNPDLKRSGFFSWDIDFAVANEQRLSIFVKTPNLSAVVYGSTGFIISKKRISQPEIGKLACTKIMSRSSCSKVKSKLASPTICPKKGNIINRTQQISATI